MAGKSIDFLKLMVQTRNDKNLTQSELAKVLGVSRSTIAKIENYEQKPTNKVIQLFITEFRDYIKSTGVEEIYTVSDENISSTTIFKVFGEKIKKIFSEIKVSNLSNETILERLEFLENENRELKEKIKSQNEYIKNFLDKE